MKINEDNINELTKDKNLFLKYAEKIKNKFDGPSAYFYLKTMNELRKKNYSSLFDDEKFIEYLYATLCSWGMHRMDSNTRMKNFNDFKDNITENKERFIELSSENIMGSDLEKIKDKIVFLFKSINIMKRENAPIFVSNSKIMHFLLPDLIPPMDKGQIIYFFFGRKRENGKKYIPLIKDEEKCFWETLCKFKEIALKLELNKKDLKNDWDTSIPKLIDNAIIGFNIDQKK